MAAPNSAWGIEIGADAIKAIRLDRDGDRVTVSDFCVIPHKKVLSTPDLDQNEMIRLGLGQFISQKPLEGEHLVMSVPGHAAFARFAKLPPVEPKKVPDIVKFEAVQQIPFPIDEVEWDYQTFMSEDSPEVEVGIFAMTRERVTQRLGLYGELGITPEVLTLSPVAVFNAMSYDHDLAKRDKAVIYLDIGTTATDLIIANEGACWIRTFPLGGTHFTEAISESFKLTYTKAEKLKQEAATSKYAKQIMQAMRPVFTDLLQDIQRSLGYYQSVHRDAELNTVVGIGSTFKIPGLRKFLGQQLQMEVLRLDEYRKIRVEGREAAAFAENAVNFATAYGLALQGVGLGTIDVNLVPINVLREQLWRGKVKWFAAAAAVAIVGGGMNFFRPMSDQQTVAGAPPGQADAVISRARAAVQEFEGVNSHLQTVGFKAENILRLTEHQRVWSRLVEDAAMSLRSTNPQPVLTGPDIDAVMNIPAGQRRLVSLTRLGGDYKPVPGRDGGPTKRTIDVTMEVTLTHDEPIQFLTSTVQQWLLDNTEREGVPYTIVPGSVSLNTNLFRTERTPKEEDAKDDDSGRIDRPPTRPTQPQRPPGGSRPGGLPAGGPGSGPTGGPGLGGGGGSGGGPGLGGGGGGSGIGGGDGGGAGIGGGGGGAGIGGGGGGTGIGGGGGGGVGGEPSDPGLNELIAMAPVPAPPAILRPDTQYYRAVITFTIELLDEAPAPLNGQNGTARHDDQGRQEVNS